MKPSAAQFNQRDGFSLIELLVVMTLLTVIVLGLMAVFNQTQRAFKVGMAQVDVLEGGRATMDLIVRDVEQMAAITGFGTQTTNFVVDVPKDNARNPIYADLLQVMPGTSEVRTNVLQEFFMVSRVNQDWIGTGYIISNGADGIGTLYRYSTKVPVRNLANVLLNYGDLYAIFRNAPLQDFNRVLDGVIHLQVTAYGVEWFDGSPIDGVLIDPYLTDYVYTNKTDIVADENYDKNGDEAGYYYSFRGDALPTAVEIELGVVEDDVVERARALPAGDIRREYLKKEAGKVHIFRQRIPIRRADPAAYKQ